MTDTMNENDRIDFTLPAPDLPEEVVEALQPWIKGLTTDVPAIQRMLQRTWQGVSREPLIRLRDQILTYEPVAIAFWRKTTWLQLRNPNVPEDDRGAGDSAFLRQPVPLGPTELSRLAAHGIIDSSTFAEFLTHFGALAEDVETSGSFIGFEYRWETLATFSPDYYEGFDEWRDALAVYHARNGDRLLLHPDGRVAWWILPEHRIESRWASFDAFLDFYVKYREIPWPLDSYGPDDLPPTYTIR